MYKEVTGRWGKCKFLSKDEYVGRSMYYYGEYGPEETDTILSLANRKCLDIGANIGCISQALIYKGFKVTAFEPQPEIFGLLETNCLKAACVNAAVGSQVGMLPMPKVHYSAKGNFGGLGIGMQSMYGTYQVPVVTIDGYGFEDIGFMKIDVEGFELEVLEGAKDTIERCRPIMYIEDDRADKSNALRQRITELGYSIEVHQPMLYRPDNYFKLERNVWDKNYASHNLICLPC